MRTLTHVVVTANFAGTERYVCLAANASAERGFSVTVIGGDPVRMRAELTSEVRWLPGARVPEAARSLLRLGRQDVCHAHLTMAEAVVVALRWRHKARVISTRHIVARRGSSTIGRALAPWIAGALDREIAISDYVAERLELRPVVVIRNGVPPAEPAWSVDSKLVLVLQRLEPEKQTSVALRAWQLSGLADSGWRMRIVGDGAQRQALEAQVLHEHIHGVEFVGTQTDVRPHLVAAGILMAPTPNEALGLSVLEAMAAGIPVVASWSGGHLETVAPQLGLNGFPPGDERAAARCLTRLANDDELRAMLSRQGRQRQTSEFSVDRMIEQMHVQYGFAPVTVGGQG